MTTIVCGSIFLGNFRIRPFLFKKNILTVKEATTVYKLENMFFIFVFKHKLIRKLPRKIDPHTIVVTKSAP